MPPLCLKFPVNRTTVELKFISISRKDWGWISVNRTTVELKWNGRCRLRLNHPAVNRTTVELKWENITSPSTSTRNC